MKNISKFLFPMLVMFTAIGLAVVAAFFSVTGLSKLFSGAAISVVIMASILELAKIVTASWLHKNWNYKEAGRALKIQLSIVVFVLMCITSAGIYGFLSSAYFEVSSKVNKVDTEIGLIEKKKIIFDGKIKNLSQLKESKTKRIENLSTLRNQQESRIDSLYKKSMFGAVKKTESQIKDANTEISSLMKEVEVLDKDIQIQNDSITSFELKKVDLMTDDAISEVGPLKYIAKLTGSSMDVVINWFILALIFVFDPLAIALIIAANISFDRAKKEIYESENKTLLNEKKEEEKPVVYVPEITEFFEQKKEVENDFKKKVEELNKEKEVVVEKEDGDFEDDYDSLLTVHLKFLNILYKGGKLKEGDEFSSYKDFLVDINKKGFPYSEKDVRDFITTCNLVKIIDTSNRNRFILKNYKISKEIIKNIF